MVENEVQILRRVSHRNIVSLHAVYITNDSMSMVLDLCKGGELFEEVVKRGASVCPFFRSVFRSQRLLLLSPSDMLVLMSLRLIFFFLFRALHGEGRATLGEGDSVRSSVPASKRDCTPRSKGCLSVCSSFLLSSSRPVFHFFSFDTVRSYCLP